MRNIRQIRTAQPSSPKKYHEYLVSKGVCSPEDYNKIREAYFAVLEKEFDERNNVKKTIENLKNPEYKGAKSMTGKWSGMDFSQYGKEGPTGISADAVKNYVYASINVPPTFNVHPRIQKYHIQHRISQIEKDLLDWPAAEAAALASLIDEGYNVRFSGQDVERGTFSHRHLVLTDIKTEEKWVPLREQSESFAPQGRFDLVNSPLSEAGVMGFEYGYSIESPRNVVIWEAQFGDFFNPAQVILLLIST
jgi:2-oxoglutarate dehydrogenase complex, dehydrogenase (E1) component, and related enzymes